MSDLIKVDEVKNIFSSFPEISSKNKVSVDKCNQAGQALLDTIEASGMSEELDQQAVIYLKKVNVTIKNLNSRRSPLTQIFDRIRSYFTSLEKEIDPNVQSTIPGRVKAMRDAYARQKYEEEQKRRREAERMAAVNNEITNYKLSLSNALSDYFNRFLNEKIATLNSLFQGLTYENYHRDSIGISVFVPEYPKSHFEKFYCTIPTQYMSEQQKKAIREEVMYGKFEEFSAQFRQQVSELKRELQDQLPSKKKELEELEAIKKKNAEAYLKAEQERKQREAEEAAKKMEELRIKQEQEKKAAEMMAQQEQVNNLFDMSAAATVAPPTNAKVKKVITILGAQGFLEVFQMWWMEEGKDLPIDELSKVFKKQITYCEKVCNKEDRTIKSQYVRYDDDVKAK